MANERKIVTSKKKPLVVVHKPIDPSRLFMSKKDALAANRKEKERAAKLDVYKKELEAEDETPPVEVQKTSFTPHKEDTDKPKKKGRPKKTEA